MKILVIDGQGGKMGAALTDQIKKNMPDAEVVAVGTNSLATSAMLRAGADAAATGENPVVVNCTWADVIVGPIGIILANALWGEITPKMAAAVSECVAKKILIPVNRCSVSVGQDALGIRAGCGRHAERHAVRNIAATVMFYEVVRQRNAFRT